MNQQHTIEAITRLDNFDAMSRCHVERDLRAQKTNGIVYTRTLRRRWPCADSVQSRSI
jgi:hypothetical protein